MFDPGTLRGWFQAGVSKDIGRSEVRTVRRFGTDLVLFRGASGRLSAVDPVCPHLGAHLGDGSVVDDCIRCPFHGWQFGPDGDAMHVPLARRVPALARVQTKPVVERGGVIFVYRPAPGDDPTASPPPLPPRLLAALAGGRKAIRSTTAFTIEGSLIEVMENAADRAHFPVVHHRGVRSASPYRWEIDDDGTFCVETELGLRFPPMPAQTRIEMFDAFNSVVVTRHRLLDKRDEFIELFTLVAPKNDTELDLLFVVASPSGIPVVDRLSHWIVHRNSIRTALEDRVIWKRKVLLDRPVLSDADGPIMAFRRWHARFAAPVQDQATSEVLVLPEPLVSSVERG